MFEDRRRALLFLTSAFAVLIFPTQASARRARVRIGSSGIRGKGAYTPNTLRPEQLEQCLLMEAEINRSAEALDVEEEKIQKEEAKLKKFSDDIDVRALTLDRYNKSSVDAYNRLIDQQKRMVAAFNKSIPSYNARVASHQAIVNQFNGDCANKQYYEADMQQAKARINAP